MNKKLLDKVLVVDIEATCWKEATPINMISDIIEIGVCLLDVKTGKITKNKGILVIPERSVINSFCTELTTITPELIDSEGIYFTEALSILEKEYQASQRTWASFGAYDRNQFKKQCKDLNLKYPFGQSHINVKNLYSLMNSKTREFGMAKVLNNLKINLEGTHHRGVDDANNIAKILKTLIV